MPDDQPTVAADQQELDWARRVVLTQSAAFIFIFMGAGAQQLYIAPYLQDCTEWSGLMRGLVAAAVYASMMVFRVANVYLLRRWSDWHLTFIGSLTYTLFTLAMLGTFWVKSYPLAIAAAIVWGWGGAAMWTGTTMQVLAATDAIKRHGIGTGFLYGAAHAGWLVGTIILGIVYQQTAWEPYSLYLVAAALTVVGNALTWLHPRKADFVPHRPTLSDLLEIAGKAKARIGAFLLVTSSLSFGLMLGVFGDHIKSQHGAQYIWITAMFYPGVRLILSLWGGWLADRTGHGFILAGGFVAAAAGMVLAAQWQTVAAAALAATALALLGGTVPVVATAMVGDSADRTRRPLAYGALFAWRDLGVVLAAVWGKVLMRGGGDFTETFNTFAVAFVLCGLVALMLQRYAKERL